MPSFGRERWWPRLGVVAYGAALLAAFYFYVLLRVRPELFYHQDPTVFLFDSHFFRGFWDQPGGAVEYVSAFLSPLFVYGWLGALVVTSLVTLICLATRQFLAALSGVGGQVIFWVPALLILMVLGQYCHPVRLCVGLFVVLVFTNVYVRMGNAGLAVRVTAFVVVSALTYYAVAGLYVVFALLCGIFELMVKRQRWLGVSCVLCAVVVPAAAGVWLFDVTVRDAYRELLLPSARYWLAVPASTKMAMTIRAGLLLFFPLAALAVTWRRPCRDSPVADCGTPPRKDLPAETASIGSRSVSRRRLAVQSAVLVVLGFGADVVSFDFPTRCLLQMADHAEHERWADVLTTVRRLSSSGIQTADVRVIFQVNRALYFSGDLLDRMFSYTQVLHSPTLTLKRKTVTDTVLATPLECGDIFFDLGRINESEHMAYEALEAFGDQPRILKRLVFINVLKGEPDAARVFLAFLEHTLLHGPWARRCRRQLDADPSLSGVPGIAARRELMVARDSDPTRQADLETVLIQLLDQNGRNRMAFEYLMAHYLLTRQVDKIAANLHRLDGFDDSRLPRHCEEALAIALDTPDSPELDLGNRTVPPETRQRYAGFRQALKQFGEDASAAFVALHGEFGDSYFFSHTFGHNDLLFEQSR